MEYGFIVDHVFLTISTGKSWVFLVRYRINQVEILEDPGWVQGVW